MARVREAVVLAGGFGTRLAHIVPDVCKPMAPVAGRPFLRFILDMLAAAGFKRIVIADGYRREQIEDFFGDSYRGMQLVYSPEDEPLGTGGAAKRALGLCIEDLVFVLNGDTYSEVDFQSMRDDFLCHDAQVSIAVKEMPELGRYGCVEFAEDGRITAFREKGSTGRGFLNTGVYLMRRDCLEHLPDVFSLESDYFEQALFDGLLRVFVAEGLFIDIGVAEDYHEAQTLLADLAHPWRLAFFDRDGTINIDTGHLFEPEKLQLIPETVTKIREYDSDPAYKVVVVTNQAGIAKGLYTEDQMRALHDYLDAQLAQEGARIDAYYFCPHHPDFTGPCDCRKPAPGMLLKALEDFDADPQACIMFGDSNKDQQAADAAGIAFVRVSQ